MANASAYLHLTPLTPERLDELATAAGLPGASIVLRSLDDGAVGTLDLRGAAAIYPASMIKVPIAMVLARLVEAGAYRLHDTVRVEAANLTAQDAPSPFVEGYLAQLGELAHAMLARSDNVATNVLIDVLDRETISDACGAFGLRTTAVRRKLSGALPLIADSAASGRNSHPAADAAALFERLARDVERKPSWVYDALRAQMWNDRLSRGWRPADRFAHKTGETDDAAHDGGILTLPAGRRFVIVVYTERPSNPETDECFAAFGARLRPLLDEPSGR